MNLLKIAESEEIYISMSYRNKNDCEKHGRKATSNHIMRNVITIISFVMTLPIVFISSIYVYMNIVNKSDSINRIAPIFEIINAKYDNPISITSNGHKPGYASYTLKLKIEKESLSLEEIVVLSCDILNDFDLLIKSYSGEIPGLNSYELVLKYDTEKLFSDKTNASSPYITLYQATNMHGYADLEASTNIFMDYSHLSSISNLKKLVIRSKDFTAESLEYIQNTSILYDFNVYIDGEMIDRENQTDRGEASMAMGKRLIVDGEWVHGAIIYFE